MLSFDYALRATLRMTWALDDFSAGDDHGAAGEVAGDEFDCCFGDFFDRCDAAAGIRLGQVLAGLSFVGAGVLDDVRHGFAHHVGFGVARDRSRLR